MGTVSRSPGAAHDLPPIPPARFDTGQSFADDAGSRVGGADHVVTPVGALEAGAGAQDARPVAEGAEPQPRSEVDPDDTSRCPTGLWCASCESPDDLAVGSAESPVGIFCVTLCGDCAEAGRLPAFRSWLEAIARVHDHAEHLDCTVDDLTSSRSTRS